MARQNLTAHARKPDNADLLTLRVLRRERLSTHFARVTLGEGDIERFTPMGFDQWFRLLLPVSDGSLHRVPRRLNMASYLRFLTVSKATRPVLRNYTARAYRQGGLTVPSSMSTSSCTRLPRAHAGSPPTEHHMPARRPVAILDEGIGFNPPQGLRRIALACDESGLPATEGILTSLAPDVRGHVIIEIPTPGDARELAHPDGVTIEFLAREDHDTTPGRATLAQVRNRSMPEEPFYGWVVGEADLAAGARRHRVTNGAPKEHVMFCTYWRSGRHA